MKVNVKRSELDDPREGPGEISKLPTAETVEVQKPDEKRSIGTS